MVTINLHEGTRHESRVTRYDKGVYTKGVWRMACGVWRMAYGVWLSALQWEASGGREGSAGHCQQEGAAAAAAAAVTMVAVPVVVGGSGGCCAVAVVAAAAAVENTAQRRWQCGVVM